MNRKETMGTMLKIRAGLGTWPQGVPINEADLFTPIITDLGRDLARLHGREGKSFGPVNNRRLFFTGKLTAPYPSWFDYLSRRFQKQSENLDQIIKEEAQTGVYLSKLSGEQREQMENILAKRPFVTNLLEEHKSLLSDVQPHVLHGNVHPGIIFVKDREYAGLADFSQMVLGDPIDDLAYASIMPQGENWKEHIIRGWKEIRNDPNLEEKMHLYRLLESYRKIYTRYTRHHWLGEYSHPLEVAQQEMNHFGI